MSVFLGWRGRSSCRRCRRFRRRGSGHYSSPSPHSKTQPSNYLSNSHYHSYTPTTTVSLPSTATTSNSPAFLSSGVGISRGRSGRSWIRGGRFPVLGGGVTGGAFRLRWGASWGCRCPFRRLGRLSVGMFLFRLLTPPTTPISSTARPQ